MIHRWFADTASGASMQRPQLRALRAQVRRGGVRRLWVWRLDRLTRSGIGDTVAAVQELRANECSCASVCEPFVFDGSPTSDLIISVMAFCNQMELQKIRENVSAGRARAVAEGRAWGRPPIDEELRQRALELRKAEQKSEREIARALKKSKTWVHRVLTTLGH